MRCMKVMAIPTIVIFSAVAAMGATKKVLDGATACTNEDTCMLQTQKSQGTGSGSLKDEAQIQEAQAVVNHGHKTMDKSTSKDATFKEFTLEELDGIIGKIQSQTAILPEEEVKTLCESAKDILLQESNVQKVRAPVTVVGDISGQFYDLLQIFGKGGKPSDTRYLFLGNYVNHGNYSVETIVLLLALKVRHPQQITLLRGNQESKQITSWQPDHTLYSEVMTKYNNSDNVWKCLVDVFDYLPLSAMVGAEVGRPYFCVHGGLSPQIDTVDNVMELDRIKDIPSEGPMCNLLWSVPDEQFGSGNNPEGMGYTFGRDISETFCHSNGISAIIRSEQSGQTVKGGYEWTHDNLVLTLFSAPNYNNEENKGAILKIDPDLKLSYTTFSQAKGPEAKSLS